MTGQPRPLRAGIVGRPHGLDGSVHVARGVAVVLGPLEVGSEVHVAGRPRRIARLAGHAARPILRLEGCDTRADAEALSGAEILVARDDAPELAPEEWWAEDLEGCAVCDGERPVGIVTALLELPSCEVLEVSRDGDDAGGGPPTRTGRPGRSALLVPLIRDAVRDVDLERRVIDVDLRFLGES